MQARLCFNKYKELLMQFLKILCIYQDLHKLKQSIYLK